jgi:hypothetical protein
MRTHSDEAAYNEGLHAVIDSDRDFDRTAMQQARIYVATRSLSDLEEALLLLQSYYIGAYDARFARQCGHGAGARAGARQA